MSKTKTTVAIYTRVSTREQAQEGYSLDAQQRLLLDYCKAKKYNVYKIYSDEGISAKDIEHRPGIKIFDIYFTPGVLKTLTANFQNTRGYQNF